jgi:hypothetical protein
MRKFIATLIFLCAFFSSTNAQHVYHHVRNNGIYDFIDELANAGIIVVNSSVKPYSRKQISQMLKKASENRESLNKRQQDELTFYLKDFGKELNETRNFPRRFDALYYRDTLFTATINPILGLNTFANDSDLVYRRWVGAEVWAYIGKGFGVYSSLRDNNENYRLGDRNFLNHYQGGGYKVKKYGGEFSEMRGGVTWDWNWGSIGLIKDHIEWGSGYNGTNIIYSRAPSFTMLKLMIKPTHWFELNFIHGWLVSQIIDSSQTYTYAGTQRNVFHPKYIAANFFTFTPFKRLNLSFGNSIIYSDMDVHPAYLTPVFFYKSIDHHLNGMSNYTGQNSQMFMDISSRQIKNLHLFATLFLDEIAMSRMFDEDRHSNFFSLKAGFRLSNFPLRNIIITAEYTRNNPQVYEHVIGTTTFESNRFNLGHYLRENSQEIFISGEVRPFRNASLVLSYTNAQKGPYTSGGPTRLGLPFMETIEWEAQILSTTFNLQVMNDSYIYAGFDYGKYSGSTQLYTPRFLVGNQFTFKLGGCYGF